MSLMDFCILLIYIFASLNFNGVKLASAAPASPADATNIKNFLTPLINAEAQGKSVDVAKILTAYTNGATSSKFIPGVTLTDIVLLHLGLIKDSAILSNDAACDIANQNAVDSFFKKTVWLEVNPDTKVVATLNQKTVYNFFQAMVKDGKKYCNFFARLYCVDNYGYTGRPPYCSCPWTMYWENGKCVFNHGEKCLESNVDGNRFVRWNLFDTTSLEDVKLKGVKLEDIAILGGGYTREIPSDCRDKNSCDHSSDDTCQTGMDSGSKYYASAKEIADFLKSHLDKNKVPHAETTDILRNELEDIYKPSRQGARLFLSLELRMEKLLVGHGHSCDYDKDQEFDKLMEIDKEMEDRWDVYNYPDAIRKDFQRRLIDLNIKVCNHFEFLHCTRTGSGGDTCGCKENLVYDSTTKLCTIAHTYLCNRDYLLMRRFQFHELTALDLNSIVPGISKYFKWEFLQCESGAKCEGVFSVSSFSCIKPGDREAAAPILEPFWKKFSIPTSSPCSVIDHEQLFGSAKSWDVTFAIAKERVEVLVKNVALQYCKLHEHATCSRADSKCACVPPTVRGGDTCVIPLHWECSSNSHYDQLHRRDEYQTLRNLVIPFRQNVPGYPNDLLCPKGYSSCKAEGRYYKYCRCNQMDKYGEACDLDPSHLVDHIQPESLPKEYRSPVYMSFLHTALTKIEARMTLKYGDSCDADANTQLLNVMESLNAMKQNCDCKWLAVDMKWDCREQSECYRESNTNEEYRPEQLRKSAKALLLLSKPLCNWIKGVRCDKTCTCAEDHFFENGECHLDSGMQCHTVRPGIDFPFKCRSGLRCGKYICEITHPAVQSVEIYEDTAPGSYLHNAFAALQFHLKGKDEEFKKMQTLSSRAHCHLKSEQKLELILKELSPVLTLDLRRESTSGFRQNFRLLEELGNKVEDVKNSENTPAYCQNNLICDPSTSKCKAKDDQDQDDAKKSKSNAASPVLVDFIPFNLFFLLIILSIMY